MNAAMNILLPASLGTIESENIWIGEDAYFKFE